MSTAKTLHGLVLNERKVVNQNVKNAVESTTNSAQLKLNPISGKQLRNQGSNSKVDDLGSDVEHEEYFSNDEEA